MAIEPDIIIIKGAPGSGKSKTAKELAKHFPNGVRLEIDTIRQMVISVDWKNQQEHINMLEASTKLIFEFLKFKYKPVIIIDTFSGDKILKFVELLLNHNNSLSIKTFALFTTDEELKRRIDLRTDNEFNDFAVCKILNDNVQKIKYLNENLLDTTGLSATQTAYEIFVSIQQKKY